MSEEQKYFVMIKTEGEYWYCITKPFEHVSEAKQYTDKLAFPWAIIKVMSTGGPHKSRSHFPAEEHRKE
jgi:hypothetical protein